MLKIAFIDHSYHKKTKSSEFFLCLLKALGSVETYWDDSWNTHIPMDFRLLDSGGYDLLVFWQILYSPEVLRQRSCQRIVLIPMYDSVGGVTPSFWLPYRKYYFINFSKALHASVSKCGIPSFYLQYFPDPKTFDVADGDRGKKVFFWERNKDLTPEIVRTWFSSCPDCSFHYHRAPDPGNESSTGAFEDNRHWTISDWFTSSEEYINVLRSCTFFVAPRKYEGIGMAFLEAMAMGLVVVGLPYPTLSEYIENGVNGLLVNVNTRIDFANVDYQSIGASARKTVEDGFLHYESRLPELKKWLGEIISGDVSYSRTLVYINLIRRIPGYILRKMRYLIHVTVKPIKKILWGIK